MSTESAPGRRALAAELLDGQHPGLELVLCGALALAVDHQLVLRAPDWTNLSQGPLLLAILVMATRHGMVWGTLMCGLAACLRVLELAWLQAAIGQRGMPALSPEVIAASFFLVVFAGTVGDTWRARRASAMLAADDAWTLLDRLSGHYTSLLDQRHLLQRQVVDLKEAVPSLVELFGELDPSQPDAIPSTMVMIAKRLAGSGEAALYAFRKRRHQGDLLAGLAKAWPPTLDRDHPVIAAAFEQGSHVTIAHIQGVSQLANLPPGTIQVACEVPVEGLPTQLVMVLKDLSLISFAPSRLQAFERAMKVSGKSFARAQAFARTRDLNVDDPLTGAVTRAYFEKRLAEHHALSRRYGNKLSLVRLELPRAAAGVRRSERRRTASRLARAVQQSLRDGDLLAGGARPDVFWILCPYTPRAGAQVVASRVAELATKTGAAASDAARVSVEEIDGRAQPLADLMAKVSA